MLRRTCAVLGLSLAACTATIGEDLDPAGTLGDDVLVDEGPSAEDDATEPAPEPDEPPGTVDGVPFFQLPFPCGQVWAGQTRTNHSPTLSVDFNRTDDLTTTGPCRSAT